MQPEIDQNRLNQEIAAIAAFSDCEAPAVTRVVFSEQDGKARAWLKELFSKQGLTIREDAVGNTFARWEGSKPELPAVATGSHVDAIPYSGRYDGVVGVLGGLEAIRTLQREGFKPERSIELILFTSEEPTRFGIGCLGSRLLSGTLSASADDTLRDGEGDSLQIVRQRAGFRGPLSGVRMGADAYSAFVELHIEQGPILEREKIAIGIVTNIAAPASFRLFIEGEGGHAGARLMPGRRDALCAAAEMVLAVERSALATGAIDTVATVGICQVHPGAINSIPSRVELVVDLRDTDEKRREGVLAAIKSACTEIADRRKVKINLEMINADAPTTSSPRILDALTAACEAEKVTYQKMVSRAYHDSSFMARIAPVAMIFIPCRDGVSHRPDEYAAPEDISRGVKVLTRTLAALAQGDS